MSRFPSVDRPVRRRRRRWQPVALVVLAGVLVAGLVVVLQRRGDLSVGPLVIGGQGMANLQPIDVGVPYSFGYMLWNEGKEPAVIQRVRVVGVTGPIEVADVWARQHPSGPRHQTFMLAFGFPPPDFPSKPLAEENVVPVPKTFSEDGSAYEGLQLVVGVKSTGPGIGRIRGIEVTYRVGDRRYRNSSDGKGFLCAPAAEYLHTGPKFRECGDLDEDRWDDKFVDVRVRADKRQ